MRLLSTVNSLPLRSAIILILSALATAGRLIESNSLNACQDNSGFTATLFDVVFTPDNGTLTYNINGVSTISGNIIADLQVIAYGYTAFNQTIDPCGNPELSSLCPMNPGQIVINSNSQFSSDIVSKIPGVAYSVPDLDGLVKILITSTTTGRQLACVEAELSNGKTVDQEAVQWTTAVIAGLGLLASAVTSGLGHSNTAAHIAANALSLFGFFQTQAMIGMTAVSLPPIVQSWTQNFQWTMGMVRIGFMQNVLTWYQRSTGGTPSTILSNLATTSVEVQKRSLKTAEKLIMNTYHAIIKRQNSPTTPNSASTRVTILRGIKRVGFRANIEITNIFLTGLSFFIAFVVIVAICVALFKGFCELAVKAGWLKGNKFQDFRNGWKTVMKGILFRLVLIGYPQICILCLWELTERDSAAEIVLALFYFIAMTVALLWAAMKVIRIAKRSVSMHKNPAYILYSDPKALNKWGFLYVQFRATAYYFILPIMVYIVIKAVFIAFAQEAPTVQGIALVIIEAIALIAVSILRPWMDKKTNVFNIAIAVVNFLNGIFLLVFTNVFNQPGIVTGVMGVIFFVYNAFFALILLIMVLVSSILAIVSKNPDTRYQPMRDDRGSFIKSQSQLNTELDALGVTARGDMKMPYKNRDLDDDDDSFSSGSLGRKQHEAGGGPLPPSTSHSTREINLNDHSRSPIDANTPFMPGDGTPRHGTPAQYTENHSGLYSGDGQYNDSTVFNSRSTNNSSPAPRYDYQPYNRAATPQSTGAYRPQNNTGPWQRGAGYDH